MDCLKNALRRIRVFSGSSHCSNLVSRYSLLATRENVWAASVCADDGCEVCITGPEVVQGDVSANKK